MFDKLLKLVPYTTVNGQTCDHMINNKVPVMTDSDRGLKNRTIYNHVINTVTGLTNYEVRLSPHDEHWSSGPRPVKLCSDQ